MWKKKYEKLKAERAELRKTIDNAVTVEAIDKIEIELRKLNMKITEAEEHIEEEKRNAPGGEDKETIDERTAAVNGDGQAVKDEPERRSADYKPGLGFTAVDKSNLGGGNVSMRKVGSEMVSETELEKRGLIWQGKDVEKRAVVLNETILIPEHQSKNIKSLPFNEVSSILDLVKVTPFTNGETYDVPFEYETGMADYTGKVGENGEGGEYNEVEVKFDSSKIRRAKVTSYTEISKEFRNTPAANYAQRVQNNITTSVKKKIARDVMIGIGGDEAIQGIFTQPPKVKNKDGKTERDNRTMDKDMELAELGNNDINDIVFSYGGDNDVEEGQVLLMNKLTLNGYAKMRDGNGNKVYDIKTFGSIFTIDGIRGVFTSYLKPFNQATEGEYFMGYGSPKAFEIALFSGLTVEEDSSYKFKQGMIAYRADQYIGGNLTEFKSFIRVKKSAVAVADVLEK